MDSTYRVPSTALGLCVYSPLHPHCTILVDTIIIPFYSRANWGTRSYMPKVQ